MTWTTRAAERAQELLNELQVHEAPIDVRDIGRQLGVIVLEEDLEGEVSGMLTREARRPVILVNRSDSITRKRFSIAHELGHFLLHKETVFVDRRVRFRNQRSSLGIDREEIEANQFAAELLMPTDFIGRIFSQLQDAGCAEDCEELVSKMAGSFEVSPQAMEIRLVNLGILSTV
ncbi:MAG: ImmA/IrrE family metallo-endopeptidase [Acidobacteriota bacterium]|nr:ImmA/IrrE family metallo-endopeptidase [Acidobacteriota bacterium]